MSESSRPTDVIILVVLQVIASLLLLATAAGTLALTAAVGALVPGLETLALFLGVIFLILGSAGLAVAWGLWTAQPWAWTPTLVLTAINILGGLLSLPSGWLTILIYVVIIYYLYRPHVKEYFGK